MINWVDVYSYWEMCAAEKMETWLRRGHVSRGACEEAKAWLARKENESLAQHEHRILYAMSRYNLYHYPIEKIKLIAEVYNPHAVPEEERLKFKYDSLSEDVKDKLRNRYVSNHMQTEWLEEELRGRLKAKNYKLALYDISIGYSSGKITIGVDCELEGWHLIQKLKPHMTAKEIKNVVRVMTCGHNRTMGMSTNTQANIEKPDPRRATLRRRRRVFALNQNVDYHLRVQLKNDLLEVLDKPLRTQMNRRLTSKIIDRAIARRDESYDMLGRTVDLYSYRYKVERYIEKANLINRQEKDADEVSAL